MKAAPPAPDSLGGLRRRPSLPFRDGPAASPRPWRGLALVLLFAIALLGFTEPIHRYIDAHPRLHFDNRIWSKQSIRPYIEHPGDTTGLFLGSSRITRGVIPRVFDAQLQDEGIEAHTLNLGRLGMNFIEMVGLLDRILTWNPGSLRFVVIELNEFDPKFLEENRRTPRYVGWHTPGATRDILEVVWRSDRSLLEKIRDSYDHVVECASYVGNVGLASRMVRTSGKPALQPRRGRVAQNAGYSRAKTDTVLAQAKFAEMDQLEPLRPGRSPGITPVHRRLLRRVDRELRTAGILPVFLRMPGYRRQSGVLDAIRLGLLPCLIDVPTDPLFSPVFTRENFQDSEHLNFEGAKSFSRLLATRVASLYRRYSLSPSTIPSERGDD